MKCLVTGAAGFIGSHLCDHLLAAGHNVIGLDAFIPYYPQYVKDRNCAAALRHPNYQFHRLDLRQGSLDSQLDGVEVIFHLAAMPGLPTSWTDFEAYMSCNVWGTQRLLEACRQSRESLRRFICVSTSSVYGRYSSGDESLPLKPISPYGITKLAAENLCRAYAEAYKLPMVVLRYFSVYGPRQRPDMAYHIFMKALLRNEPLVIYGDGLQMRGNTFVNDCVQATVAAVEAPVGETYNVGGGESATVLDIIQQLQTLAGRKAVVRHEPGRQGDQRSTFADTTKIRSHLNWVPRIKLDDGLAQQWRWHEIELAQPALPPGCPG